MDQAHQMKMAKCEDLVGEVQSQGHQAKCLALEVGSRGLLTESELSQLRNALKSPPLTCNPGLI